MDIKAGTSQDEIHALLQQQSDLFHYISTIDEQTLSVRSLLEKAAEIIKEGWIYPQVVSVELAHNHTSYISKEFQKTDHFIETRTSIKKDASLTLRIYLDSKRDIAEPERKLADVMVQNVAAKLDHILSRIELEEEQEMLDKAYKLAHIGTWEYDMINDELYWSDVTKEVHGFGVDYDPDVESTIQLFKEGYHRDIFEKAATDAIEKEIPFDVELKIISGQGDERWIRATGEPEYDDEGVCLRFYGISQNVTSRRQAEEDLEHNERRFKAMVKSGTDMIAILDGDANYKYVSPAVRHVLGTQPEHYIGNNAFDFLHDDDAERLRTQFEGLAVGDTTQLKPYRFKNSEGKWRWLESTITNLSTDPAVKGYVANSRDVTERQTKQEEILNNLKQKETLLAEVHHRIKNNLSVVTGLLQMQAADEDNEEVLGRLFDSVARINTMASIHEQLYKTEQFSEIEFADRIQLLAQNIQKSFQSETDVSLNFQCEPFKIDPSRALPCSLIVNEVLTNIFKHAFEGRDEGKITLSLTQTDIEDYMKLSIADNGKGLPENFTPKEGDSLGVKLIDMLSEQIRAQYFYESSDEGTTFTILFKKDI